MMDKIVCYAMTRNIYEDAIASIKSLLINGNIDKVYLLIEDDDFPYICSDKVFIINVSEQKYILPTSPNYDRKWTYMVMMRPLVFKFFPNETRMLTMDIDTIVRGDISPIWDMDMTNIYVAGAYEPSKCLNGQTYANMGVAFWNLEMMRDGTGDRIIEALNTKTYPFCEQDCVNFECAGHIKELPSKYNSNAFTKHTKEVIIRHYAFTKNWQTFPEVLEYKWKEI